MKNYQEDFDILMDHVRDCHTHLQRSIDAMKTLDGDVFGTTSNNTRRWRIRDEMIDNMETCLSTNLDFSDNH